MSKEKKNRLTCYEKKIDKIIFFSKLMSETYFPNIHPQMQFGVYKEIQNNQPNLDLEYVEKLDEINSNILPIRISSENNINWWKPFAKLGSVFLFADQMFRSEDEFKSKCSLQSDKKIQALQDLLKSDRQLKLSWHINFDQVHNQNLSQQKVLSRIGYWRLQGSQSIVNVQPLTCVNNIRLNVLKYNPKSTIISHTFNFKLYKPQSQIKQNITTPQPKTYLLTCFGSKGQNLTMKTQIYNQFPKLDSGAQIDRYTYLLDSGKQKYTYNYSKEDSNKILCGSTSEPILKPTNYIGYVEATQSPKLLMSRRCNSPWSYGCSFFNQEQLYVLEYPKTWKNISIK